MATKGRWQWGEVNKSNFSKIRTTIESAFYGNNVELLTSRREAYKKAMKSPGTIVTDLPVYKPELLNLDEGTKILLFNDGAVVGRFSGARKIIGMPNVNEDVLAEVVREAVYGTRFRKMHHAISYTGLHEDFMVKNHILIPEGFENTVYNWLLNFQDLTPEYSLMYERSKVLNEPDIYIFTDPDWTHPDFPGGLALFDPKNNCAALLGLRYFGEFKKGTLTLGWSVGNRQSYVACHGGLKKYEFDSRRYVAAFFGLSGSGKSTLTHSKHNGKYNITVLHDDALVINLEDLSSIALEPSYFDKTSDYPLTSEDNKFLLTIQNCGATVDEHGRVVPVMEDIRNGNGRAIKSRLWSPNRVDKIDEPVNAIFWIMKDPVLPPVVKIEDPILASTMGATLATKRTSAERLLPGVDPEALVFEPYANPFRTYPLSEDYEKFKKLFEKGVECYIINTGFYLNKKVPKEVTLEIVENIVEKKSNFIEWFGGLKIMEIPGFEVKTSEYEYRELLRVSLEKRIEFINQKDGENQGYDRLPRECRDAIENLIALL
ncbi:MAG: phosphoenolpyruvate carboxykinase (ATP) [Fervidobacterium sp.]|uniref:phosphoenolpyruvate carboxykinase (ATP) n=1 Tax=Fervidobacterium gondwanense DSM 13020 TaxID=1121883 RepID=A0A1M7TIH9_FERGO|nr:phosphoenolpyruvate carboxykinase (ATP) [Fervidobacterium gondwanense]UXF00226.1 phosphoenolpyruvate carboxykinase [Fervidobacterium riparium]SHN70506.1 phosphoenolpyruvate carboxykinase (ATP) [Fervidobacterium gondwanense DSM 13020]